MSVHEMEWLRACAAAQETERDEELGTDANWRWLTGLVRAGRGQISFTETESGDIGLFFSEEPTARVSGDSIEEVVGSARKVCSRCGDQRQVIAYGMPDGSTRDDLAKWCSRCMGTP
jgi:hypothetical protein